MYDIDKVLSVVENPTRRKILQALVREPHYPLQLSKELGVSQQAIVKNLNIMERDGIVISYRESSDIGPDRIFYRLSSEFTVIIDLRNNMFEATMISPEATEGTNDETIDDIELERVREKIADIDRHICELDRMRSEMIRQRNALITAFTERMNDQNIDYTHRSILYEMLNRPDMDTKRMSEELGMNERFLIDMIDEIMHSIEDITRR